MLRFCGASGTSLPLGLVTNEIGSKDTEAGGDILGLSSSGASLGCCSELTVGEYDLSDTFATSVKGSDDIIDDGLVETLFVTDGRVTNEIGSDVFLVGGSASWGRCVVIDGWGDETFLAASWSPVDDLLELLIMSVSSLLQAFANSSSGLFKEMLSGGCT